MKKDEILEELKSNTGEYSTGWDLDEYITTKEFEEEYSWHVVHDEIEDGGRWSIMQYVVTQITENKTGERFYFEACWDDPATEMQEGQSTNLSIYEVVPHEVTVIKYIGA